MEDEEKGPLLDAAVVVVCVLFGLLGLALLIAATFTIIFCWYKKHIVKHVNKAHLSIRKEENHAAYGRNAADQPNACVASLAISLSSSYSSLSLSLSLSLSPLPG